MRTILLFITCLSFTACVSEQHDAEMRPTCSPGHFENNATDDNCVEPQPNNGSQNFGYGSGF